MKERQKMKNDVMLQCVYCGTTSDEPADDDIEKWHYLSVGRGVCWLCIEIGIYDEDMEGKQ